ncbi:DUF5659 domain-containing protein [Virgibacillus sp. SK37]|uniref:DUF5659 domain-containing protein n=1 Tax=Virgibacillus sp. SK37 TaxID=403957 RepID=UPI0004D0DDE4|nr:DUF5659 domain-containing protein [Virgibacillus sp. SK37]AIF45403.1 hypothetical protein X953_09990 [Virgibacillus sp. SK37]
MSTTEIKNTITIHSRKMAIYLQCRGFVLINMKENLSNSFKVFLFSDTPEIREAMSDYKKDNRFHTFITRIEGR